MESARKCCRYAACASASPSAVIAAADTGVDRPVPRWSCTRRVTYVSAFHTIQQAYPPPNTSDCRTSRRTAQARTRSSTLNFSTAAPIHPPLSTCATARVRVGVRAERRAQRFRGGRRRRGRWTSKPQSATHRARRLEAGTSCKVHQRWQLVAVCHSAGGHHLANEHADRALRARRALPASAVSSVEAVSTYAPLPWQGPSCMLMKEVSSSPAPGPPPTTRFGWERAGRGGDAPAWHPCGPTAPRRCGP